MALWSSPAAFAQERDGPVVASGDPPQVLEAAEQDRLVNQRQEAAEALDPNAVDYYVEAFRVDRAEAQRRLVLQGTAPNVASMLKRDLSDGLSSLWFDNGAGEWVVAITNQASREATARLLESYGLSGGYRIIRRTISHTELAGDVDKIAEDLDDLIEDRRVTLGLGEGRVELTLAAGLTPEERSRIQAAAGTTPDARSMQSSGHS